MEKLHSDQAMTVCKTANKFPLHRQMAVINNVKQEKLLRTLNLCRETDRQQTFTPDWPHESAPPGRDMAAAGWFYLGNLDRAQCFSCGGVLRNWRRLDNPFTEHITHFPHCSMAQGQEAHNVPNNTPKVKIPIPLLDEFAILVKESRKMKKIPSIVSKHYINYHNKTKFYDWNAKEKR